MKKLMKKIMQMLQLFQCKFDLLCCINFTVQDSFHISHSELRRGGGVGGLLNPLLALALTISCKYCVCSGGLWETMPVHIHMCKPK